MLSVLLPLLLGAPTEVARLNLTQPVAAAAWAATHDLSGAEATVEGLKLNISGSDPYSVGPVVDLPADTPLWLTIRLKSDAEGTAQLFWGSAGFSEQESARFFVPGGEWTEVRAPLPSLGPGVRLRFDPPGGKGVCVVSTMSFSTRTVRAAASWPTPTATPLPAGAPEIASGDLRWRADPKRLGATEVLWRGAVLARGYEQARLAYTSADDQPRWTDLGAGTTTARRRGERLISETRVSDEDGGRWLLTTTIARGRQAGRLDVTVSLTCDQDRLLDFAPLLVLFPGLGGGGAAARNQALLAGVEYLDAPDTSSSEADLEGEQSQRQVVDTAKLTMPLMVCQGQGQWLSVAWQPQPEICAVFDMPDRLLGSGANLMGLLAPGSDGGNRPENSLLPYGGWPLRATVPLVLRATLNAGQGDDIVPAVQLWVAQNGLPKQPAVDKPTYLRDAAAGWLDTPLREGNHYRHAWWPGVTSFGPQPAADAYLYQLWLASRLDDSALADRLRTAATEALTGISPGQRFNSGVGHVRYPVVPLLTRDCAAMVEAARNLGRATLGRFEPDGRVLYRPSEGRPDFGRTHFAPDANGLTSQLVATVLECALVSGDAGLTKEGLRLLRALNDFDHSVPRGAQTWECALHTPDILASAHLVRAYTMGYELTGEQDLLDRARYWAWTGVPFVYLTPAAYQPMGPYATIAVLGATHWVAPNWMGMPVQWCGLVYADAIARLARYDPAGPWTKLANGITASGIVQSWPASSPQLVGLLPDSVIPRNRQRNPVAINPGTVGANAARLLDGQPLYDCWVDREHGLVVHAAGGLSLIKSGPQELRLRLRAWPDASEVLVVGRTDGWAQVLPAGATPGASGPGWLSAIGLPEIVLRHD